MTARLESILYLVNRIDCSNKYTLYIFFREGLTNDFSFSGRRKEKRFTKQLTATLAGH